MSVPSDLKYTESHEWVRIDGDVATVGITDFAQDQLGDVVFVDMPEVGAVVSKGDSIAEVESTKTVSDIYAPLSGTIEAVNENLDGNEELVNKEPYGEGWLFRIKLSDSGEVANLLDAAAYTRVVEESDH
ncbi:MAG: glycine cleavage system protein GcvH [Deltaproteobacteria bacterium]|nr:MAG: glycine cleavage system protein GcvH [Deltaproteobacteria bacterium]